MIAIGILNSGKNDIFKRCESKQIMNGLKRMGSLGQVLTAIALAVSPGLAQNVEQVKLVFQHVTRNVPKFAGNLLAHLRRHVVGVPSLYHGTVLESNYADFHSSFLLLPARSPKLVVC